MPNENPKETPYFRKGEDLDITKSIRNLQEEIAKSIESKAGIEEIDTLRKELKTLQEQFNDKLDVLEGDITAKVQSQLEVQKTNPIDDLFQPFEEAGSGKFSKSIKWDLKTVLERRVHLKAYLDSTAVTGGVQTALDAWTTLVQGNPLRNYQRVIPIAGGTATIPQLGAIEFAKEASVPANGRTAGGSISGGSVETIDNWVSETAFSEPSLDDIPMLDEVIEFEHLQQYSKSMGVEGAAKLKAATGVTEVNTGVAANLPTRANVIGKMADLMAAVSSPYLPGAIFAMSKELEAVVISANQNNVYAFNIPMGMSTLFGYPVVRNDHLDRGNAANQVSGYFGNFMRALYLLERQVLRLDRFMETRPGAVTYFARGRFSQIVVDKDAIARLKTAS